MKTLTFLLLFIFGLQYAGATKMFRIQPKAVYDIEGEIVGYANYVEYNMSWASDNCEVVNIYFRFLATSTSTAALRTGNRWNVDVRNKFFQYDSIAVDVVADTLGLTHIP